VPLTQGYFALVDAADAERVSKCSWSVAAHGTNIYARRGYTEGGRNRSQFLHTFIMGHASADHINGNGLDNRRSNLRPATRSQNMGNTRKTRGSSRFKGVKWRADRGKWSAQIMVNRQAARLGTFTSEVEAALAYDKAARAGWGEFAALNFPGPGERSALHRAPAMRGEAAARKIPRPLELRLERCSRGHEYTPETTYIRSNGRPSCRPCRAARQRARHARRKVDSSGSKG
jgi:hypothetical protein